MITFAMLKSRLHHIAIEIAKIRSSDTGVTVGITLFFIEWLSSTTV